MLLNEFTVALDNAWNLFLERVTIDHTEDLGNELAFIPLYMVRLIEWLDWLKELYRPCAWP